MPQRLSIHTDETSLVISSAAPHPVYLKSVEEGKAIVDAKDLVITSSGYGSMDDALDAAEKWKVIIMVSFSRHKLGVDFGDRAPHSAFTDYGLEMLSREHGGRRILNDTHGVAAFTTSPRPLFAKASADLVVSKDLNLIKSVIASAEEISLEVPEKYHIAYDLFAASFFHTSEDARFLTLMMAVETLIEQTRQQPEILQHIAELINLTHSSQLNAEQKENLTNALRLLEKQSIGQAGKNLAASLGGARYAEMPAVRFFGKCYALRSALVHGHNPRPERDRVGIMAAQLELFVGDLLSRWL